MKASVVIPVYNRKEEIKRCVNSLLNQNYPPEDYEIIIIDDGSKEDLSFLKGERVKYFKQKNQGPAIARNLGIKKSQGEIILFIDSDCVAGENWITEIVKEFKNNIGCVGGRTIEQKNKGIFNLLINTKNIQDKAYFPTNNVGYLKKALEKVKGFNSLFDRPGTEDVELCLNIQKEGYDKIQNNQAIVYHHHKNTLKERIKQSFNFGFGDTAFMLIHPDKKRFRPFLIFYIPLLSLKNTIKQSKNQIVYFPLIYITNLLLFYSNLIGKVYHAFKKKKYSLVLYVPLHQI